MADPGLELMPFWLTQDFRLLNTLSSEMLGPDTEGKADRVLTTGRVPASSPTQFGGKFRPGMGEWILSRK